MCLGGGSEPSVDTTGPMGRSARETIGSVVPLVFCENRNIAVLKQAFQEEQGFAQPNIYRQQVAELVRLYAEGKTKTTETHAMEPEPYSPTRPKVLENVDGIKFLMHEGGCGGTREDANNLCGLLAGYIHHPNVAGATVLSLGCQNSQIEILREQIARRSPHFSKPMFVFEQQQSGSEFKMLSEAILSSFIGLMEENKSQRVPASLSLERGFEVRRLGWVFRYICESRESGKSCRLGLRYESFARKHSGWISDRRHEIRWGGQEGRSFPGDCCARLS